MMKRISKKKKEKYIPPAVLKEWVNDIQGGELYEAFILDNKTVGSACGRYAHSSGAKIVSWNEFNEGKIDQLIKDTMGEKVLFEMHEFIKDKNA